MLVAAGLAVPSAALAQDGLFADVSAGVHEPAISALAERGVFEGTLCGDGLFCPGDEIARSTVAVWLVRVLEDAEPPPVEASRFDDVDSAGWEARYIERLAELAVTAGCATDPLRYCPDQPVSRAQMASLLVRAFDLQPAGAAGFADTTGSVHRADIDALAAARITVGCATGPLRYCPDRPVTRAQMAIFLARALGIISAPPMRLPEVAAGDIHTCATRADATVVCWGDNTFGQATPPEGAFKAVEAGAIHTCAITTEGTVACWGDNSLGQADPPDGAFQAVSAGWGHSCAAAVDGAISCWGDDIYGRTNAPAGTYTAVTAGAAHSCAITPQGAISCWGWNHYGQTDAPAGVFEAVAAGAFHTCAIAAGTISCWGWNHYGQTGAPAGVFQAVTVGWDHGCA
ncbi:MAG: S-layer homology domain-containing protein, partial [Acidimicrobiaceae bacterium]|nr:S-layer homology domain-containing protein [Acidimicrobiaceae bacterium]